MDKIDTLWRTINSAYMIEQYQGITISAPEGIAYRYKWINQEKHLELAEKYVKSPYGQHLRAVAEGKVLG